MPVANASGECSGERGIWLSKHPFCNSTSPSRAGLFKIWNYMEFFMYMKDLKKKDSTENSDSPFLSSLLPDFGKVCGRNKRGMKREILAVADKWMTIDYATDSSTG